MSKFFFFIFSIFGSFFSFFVISSINPVNSVLFLVATFICFAITLFLLQLEFIPLMFIIIYVGAIAILFLFVVMLLNIKLATRTSDFFKYFPFSSLTALFFWACILSQLNYNLLSPQTINKTFQEYFWFLFLDNLTNLEVIGQVLYTYFFLLFLVAGIILFVAMVGSIALTFQYNKKVKNQYLFRQLSRNQKKALFFMSDP